MQSPENERKSVDSDDHGRCPDGTQRNGTNCSRERTPADVSAENIPVAFWDPLACWKQLQKSVAGRTEAKRKKTKRYEPIRTYNVKFQGSALTWRTWDDVHQYRLLCSRLSTEDGGRCVHKDWSERLERNVGAKLWSAREGGREGGKRDTWRDKE
jgi:hypothetical protein